MCKKMKNDRIESEKSNASTKVEFERDGQAPRRTRRTKSTGKKVESDLEERSCE